MFEQGMIIKTRKLSPREVKKKLRNFIDEISEDCGPEVEEMADELKEHGDAFIDSLSGGSASYRDGRGPMYRENGGGSNGSMSGSWRNGMRRA